MIDNCTLTLVNEKREQNLRKAGTLSCLEVWKMRGFVQGCA